MAWGDGINAALVLVVDKNTLRLNGVDYVKERTCHVERCIDMGAYGIQWVFTCGHSSNELIQPPYCPWCGAKVVEE